MHFDHRTYAQRVLFGSHRAADHLRTVVSEYAAQRLMVIASNSQRQVARGLTGNLDVVLEYTDVAMHVPIDTAQRARAAAAAHDIDLIVAIGGGSTTGLAKAVALTTQLPVVAIPTTYSGSEATNVWGITEHQRKVTGIDDAVLPAVIIYDAALMLELPVDLAVASGLNGLAHCIDSMWAPRANPINAALAAEGIRAINVGLPQIVADPKDLVGREHALYGAYLSAAAFASAGSGLHHKICHVLGGTYNLPHAQTHAVVLPYVLAYNQHSARPAAERIAGAFGTSDALSGLQHLRTAINAPQALADYGYTAANIPETVEIMMGNLPANNPRSITAEHLTELLTAALNGRDPAALLT